MKVVRTIKALRQAMVLLKRPVGFVPTMGYFHEGHLSLMRRARQECGSCVVSLFVNPSQFGPREDLSRYPRDLARDKRLARAGGVEVLFVPEVKEIYPQAGVLTTVEVPDLPDRLCGATRPGHFRGVATVVTKLLNIVQPQVMYLGQKDAQQAAVLKKMVRELNFPVKVVVCPTVREADGLAMSSRNSYLTPTERARASALYRSLQMARHAILQGRSDAEKIILQIKKLLLEETGASIDYISIVSASDLTPLRRAAGEVLIAVAVRFPSARLIDNIMVKVPRNEARSQKT